VKLPVFDLERWFARYEFNVEHNLCASCAGTAGTGDILTLAGEEGLKGYLSLDLDYIPSEGTPALRKEIAATYRGIEPEDIRVTTGASEAIFILMNLLFDPGDELIVQAPIYQSLYSVAEGLGCRVRFWQGTMEKGFLPFPDELDGMITSRTKALVINNPHSPTGVVFPGGYLERLVEIAEEHDLVLICDEVYRGLVFEEGLNTFSPVELSPKAVSIGDLTKPFGLGGLRVGWIASRDQGLLERVGMFRDYTTMCCAAPSEYLAVIALANRQTLLREKIATAKTNRARFYSFIDRHGMLLEWVPPLGGVSAFPRLKKGAPARDFCTRLAEEKSVLLLPGDVFGMESHFRIGFGSEPEKFLEGLERVEEFVSEYM